MKRILLALAVLACAGCQGPTAQSAAPSIEWSRHDLGPDGPGIVSVVAGGDGLLGVGSLTFDAGSGIWTSADGLSWREVDPVRAGRSLAAITAGGPGFVAISASPAAVWTSADGLRWTEAPADPDFADSQPRAVAESNGVLVAVGGGGLLASDDGLSWRRVQLPGAGGTMTDVAAAGPGFVAVGWRTVSSMVVDAVIWTSTDGSAWTQVPDHPDLKRAQLEGVVAVDGRLVATGFAIEAERGIFAAPAAWMSADGLTWRRAEVKDDLVPVRSPPFSGDLEGAVMGPTTRTAAGWVSTGAAFTSGAPGGLFMDLPVWTSSDGTRWTRSAHRRQFEVGIDVSMTFAGRAIVEHDGKVFIFGHTAGPQTTVWISPPQPGGTEPPPRPTPQPAPTGDSTVATPAPEAP